NSEPETSEMVAGTLLHNCVRFALLLEATEKLFSHLKKYTSQIKTTLWFTRQTARQSLLHRLGNNPRVSYFAPPCLSKYLTPATVQGSSWPTR
ncbi:hypothetical protein AVEN_119803-1, partial [Araneus ventricosus]